MKRFTVVSLFVACAIWLAACSYAQTQHSSDKIGSFWKWFQEHHRELSAMDGPQGPIFSDLATKIKEIDNSVAFEIGPAPEGKREFAVSADCHAELFPLVEEIVAAAPRVDGWKVVAFRQRTPPDILKELSVSAHLAESGKMVPGEPPVHVAVKDMRFSIKRVGNKAHIIVFIKDYRDIEPQRNMARMMLQQAVGEYDLVKKVQDVQYESMSEPNAKDASPFAQLGDALDKLLSKNDT